MHGASFPANICSNFFFFFFRTTSNIEDERGHAEEEVETPLEDRPPSAATDSSELTPSYPSSLSNVMDESTLQVSVCPLCLSVILFVSMCQSEHFFFFF